MTTMNPKAFHGPTAAAADALRRVIAARRDRLIAVQRREHSPARAELIANLGDEYRVVLAIALAAGAES